MSRDLFLNLIFLSCVLAIYAEDFYADVPVYSQLSSLTNPTIQDFHKVQNYLTYGERSIIKLLNDYQPNARNLKIIGNSLNEQPVYEDIAVNCDKNDRENCVVCYASFNKNYPRGLRRLVEFIKKSDFRGHILYRLGGWPDLAGGSLKLAHVPYAFKVSFLKEAKAMGFKRALWLDTSILPVVSLNTIFDMIKKDGYFAMGNSHTIGDYTNHYIRNAFNITLAQANAIPSCSAGITGLDFSCSIGNTILEQWYAAAENKVAFFSPRSDQNALSIILYKLNLKLCPIERLSHNRKEINNKTLLLIEREFVNELSLGR